MLHAKLTSGSEEEDFERFFTMYGHGSHLGHVTYTIYINFLSHFPRRIYMKLALIGHMVSEKKKIMVIYMYTTAGQGQTTP